MYIIPAQVPAALKTEKNETIKQTAESGRELRTILDCITILCQV